MKNFKKSIAWMLTLVMVISCMVVPAYAEDNPDARTAITTAEELMAISADMTGNYYLANDIELTGTFTPIGLGEQDDVPFTGVFDGQGHKITGLKYKNDDAGNVGLFAINEGTICNLTITGNVEAYTCTGIVAGVNSGLIENVHVTGSYVYGYEDTSSTSNLYASGNYIGGITGKNKSKGIIRSCSVEGSNVNGVRWIGGLAGANAGLMEQSWVTGTGLNQTMDIEKLARNAMIVLINNSKYAYSKLGMFTGENTSVGSINNCFVYDCNMKGWENVGGLVGCLVNPGTVKNSYAAEVNISYYSSYSYAGYTASPDYINLTIGEYSNSNQISGVYYNYGSKNIGSGKGYTIASGALKQQSTFKEFDFDKIWAIDAAKNGGYPYLQVSESTPDEPEIETYTITYVYNNENKVTDTVNAGDCFEVKGADICYDGLYDNTEYVKVTGWTDGTNTYAIGAEITPTSDLTLTACTVSVIELCDGETEDVIGVLSEDEYEAGKNGEIVNGLSYNMASTFDILPGGDAGFSVDGTRKFIQPIEGDEYEEAFAGWFYTPCDNQLPYALNWSGENNVGEDDLFTSSRVVNHRIYAYWINSDFLKTTISYRTNDKYASQVYANSTVPGDIFGNYGFVLSTTAGENDEDKLVIGGKIGAKPVGNFYKTAIYQKFKASPIYNKNYTAKDFNGGLAGFDNNGSGNGYITYFYWRNMQLYDGNGNPTSLAARAYYTTREGTVVYGDMERVVFEPNTIYPAGK